MKPRTVPSLETLHKWLFGGGPLAAGKRPASRLLRVEALEQRQLLSASPIIAPLAAKAVAASAVDNGGNTFETALDLGTLQGTRAIDDYVGPSDTNDYYRFRVTGESNFFLNLTGLASDADVRLLSSLGSVIVSSTRIGTSSETITRTLAPGTYTVLVYPYANSSTNYTLWLSANLLTPQTDMAGSSLKEAFDAGWLGGVYTFDDSVGQTDKNDCYRFSTGATTNFRLALSAMTANADVELLNSSGGLLAKSTRSGTTAEAIQRTLSIGTYYIRVYPFGTANTDYTLTLTANLPTNKPILVKPATATLSRDAASALLSVVAIDNGGPANLTFTWQTLTVPSGVATPTFSINGDSNAYKTTATFAGPGNYKFRVTVADADANKVVSDVSLTVPVAPPQPPPPPPPPSDYQITLVLVGLTPSQQAMAQQAAGRWERVIIGDLPPAQYMGQQIDDVLVTINSLPIDGPGGILGYGGPDAWRPVTLLPYAGSLTLDTADMAMLESMGALNDVFTHEIGHVIGFGIFWQQKGLLTGVGTADPRFIGTQATAQYNSVFGTNEPGVPVEAGGGPGTALAHWRESLLVSELMTGYLDLGGCALSRITVGSMADIGYTVNLAAAEPYAKPIKQAATGTPGVPKTAKPLRWNKRYLGADGDADLAFASALVYQDLHHDRVSDRLGVPTIAPATASLVAFGGQSRSQHLDYGIPPTSLVRVTAGDAAESDWSLLKPGSRSDAVAAEDASPALGWSERARFVDLALETTLAWPASG